jgi:hypothetical protein
VRSWRLGRWPATGRLPFDAGDPFALWLFLRRLSHAVFGWDDLAGTALIVYYGLDVAPPRAEQDTGRVLAARIAGVGRPGQPMSVATVRRHLRAAENTLARRADRRQPPIPSAGADETVPAPAADAFGALVASLPPPPWGALERRLAHGLVQLHLPVPGRGQATGDARRARKSRAVRTAEANLAVARAVLSGTRIRWDRPPRGGRRSAPGPAPAAVDSALRGEVTVEAYEGLLDLCRRALSADGLMAPVWLRQASRLREQLGASLDSGTGRRLMTVESWYRGQLAYDYQDIAALGPHPMPGSPRLRRLTPLGRADGFRTSSTHAAMIFETRVLTAHGYFAEALAAVRQRRIDLVRVGDHREADADTTRPARLKSRLMANQTELEVVVAQLEQPDGQTQTASTRHLYRQAEALVEAILEDSLELTGDFGYSHFAALAVRLYAAMARRATTLRRRGALLATAHRVLDREPMYAPCPCGCTASSNGAMLRLAVAEGDIPVLIDELRAAGDRARHAKYFDGDVMELLLLHRQASRIVDLPELSMDPELFRPRPGSPVRHHVAWLYLVGGDGP